jgi:WD40 repeat protein
MQHRLSTALFALIAVISTGCQIAVQAIDLVTPSEPANILKEQDIPSFADLKPSSGATIQSHQGEVLAVRPVPGNSSLIVTVGKDKKVVMWDLPSGQGTLIRQLNEQPIVATLGAKRALVAFATDSGIFVECIQGCSKTFSFKQLKSRPSSLVFHKDDTSLVIGGLDGRVYRWRFMEEQESSTTEEREMMVERYFAHSAVVSTVAPHPAGRAFFSADWSGNLIGWSSYSADAFGGAFDKNLFRGRFYADIPNAIFASRLPDRGVCSMAISHNGERLALGLEDGNVEVWEVRGFTLAAKKLLHNGRVVSVDISGDGTRVVSAGKDTKVRVTELVDDPAHQINPYALPKLLQEVSENPIPLADLVTFISPNQVVVTTKQGNLAEIRVQGTPAPVPTPKPKKAAPADTDY